MIRSNFQPLIFLTTVILGTLFVVKVSEYSHQQSTPYKRSFRVAAISFQFSIHPQTVFEKYVQELEKATNTRWDITVFDGKRDRLLLQSMIDEILLNNYDLIYAIGTNASSLTLQHLRKRGKKIPLVFTGILKDTWDDWCAANPNVKHQATGVYGSYDWPRRVQILKLLLPHTRHVIIPIPSNTSEYSHEKAAVLKEELARQGITCRIIDIENKSDGVQKLRPFLANTDAMILQREIAGLGFLGLILELATRSHVPTYSADANSVHLGGTFGIGIDEAAPGIIAADFTKKILLQNKPLIDLPPADLNEMGSHIMINEQKYRTTTAFPDERLLFLAKKGFVINSRKRISPCLF